MKKRLVLLLLLALALLMTACAVNKTPSDPIMAKWAVTYNDGNSKLLFNFEDVGDLDIVRWEMDETEGSFAQVEDYAGSFTLDRDNSQFTAMFDDVSYTFDYELVAKETLTVTYGDKSVTLNFVETNRAAN